MGIRYTTGEHVGIADGEAIALVHSSAPAGLAEEVWEALRSDAGVAGAIQLIIAAHGGDVRAIPPFAVVAPHDDGALVAVRGPLAARLVVGGSEEEISGAHVITWNERWVARPDDVELAVAGPRPQVEEWWPLVSGVVRAGAIRHQALVAGTSAPHRPELSPRAEPTSAVVGPAPEQAPPIGDPPAAAPVSAGPSLTEVTLLPDEEPPVSSPEVAVGPDSDAAEVPPESAPEPSSDAIVVEQTAAEAGDDGYDHLFGRTVLRQVEDAAVRDEDEEDEDGGAGHEVPASTPIAPADPPPAAESPPGPTTGPHRGPLISEVPGMTDEYAQDHDGETVSRSALAGLRRPEGAGGGRPSQEPPTAGLVLGRRCPVGHICPPDAATCRSCGAALDIEPSLVPRPPLGSARLSSGEVVALEASLVLGRAPRLDRFTGPDLPTVVTVPSPTREISATHLGVRLEDWHVLVTDLGSSNGTVLQRAGQPPRKLHPHEGELVRSGDVVDLGDGLTIVFEDLP